MAIKFIIREFLSFMRIETCLFVTGMSLSGYLLFNHPGFKIFPLFLAIMLGTGASYAYNHLTDRREDAVNNRVLNTFVLNANLGRKIVFFLFLYGLFFSIFLSPASALLYSSLIILSLVYSGFRIKETRIKNVFTGFSMALTFLIGAVVSGSLSFEILSYFPLIFLFGFAINMLGDMRGFRGDKKIGMKTFPIIFGFGITKIVIYTTAGIFLVCVMFSGFSKLYPLIPFLLLASFCLWKNNLKGTRFAILSSFISLPVFIAMMGVFGG
jgi:4-hydroxybenzoate polyprenyltransferase